MGLSEEKMQTQSKFVGRFGGLGIVCGILFAVVVVLTGGQPGDGANSATVITYYHSHAASQTAAVFALAVFAVGFAFFLSSLRRALSRGEDGRILSAIVTMGGAVYTGGILFMGVLLITLIHVANMKLTGAAQTLNVLAANTWVPVVTGLSMLTLATGIAGIRSGGLPRWLAWVSVGLGVLALCGPLGGLALMLTPVWMLVTGIVLLRAASTAGDGVDMMNGPTIGTRRRVDVQ